MGPDGLRNEIMRSIVTGSNFPHELTEQILSKNVNNIFLVKSVCLKRFSSFILLIKKKQLYFNQRTEKVVMCDINF